MAGIPEELFRAEGGFDWVVLWRTYGITSWNFLREREGLAVTYCLEEALPCRSVSAAALGVP